MEIGNLGIVGAPALALAPMAGYTDVAFRQLAAENGADLLYTELASATAIARGKAGKTLRIIEASEKGITGIQLFTSNPSDLGKTVKAVCEKIQSGYSAAKFIDINLGCPAPKVVKTGAGSALLGSPGKLRQVFSAAARASSLPVTAKMRTGYHEAKVPEIAKLLEDEGAAAIAVHGRTASQKFSGKADWCAIKQAVEAVSIPVIGNGDVHCAEDALRMAETTGCQGVMIGRAALSDPFIFRHVREIQEKGECRETTPAQKSNFLSKYLLLSKQRGIPFQAARSLSMQLCSGKRGAAAIRGRVNFAKTGEDLLSALNSLQAH